MTGPRPGRRRAALVPMSTMLPLLFLLFSTTASAASAVLGIDIGSSYIKAAIVKPGTPLDIVLTKDSKRKEAAVVAFKPIPGAPLAVGSFPERLYGGDALALAGRFPGDVYTNLKSLLGLAPGDEGATMLTSYRERHPAIKIEESQEQGTILLQSSAFSPSELPWSVDELLAMELKNIRTNAEAFAGKGSKITDAVITVPAFYTADERRAIERAADLAGLNVMGLVSDGLAVGIDYTVKREFPNVSKGEKPELHLVFDMGHESTTATILRFQGKEVKDIGKFNKTVQEVTVLGSGWDRTLGGNALNRLLVDYLVDGFSKKSGISAAEVKGHGRTSAKLWREAERARQVLSANSDVRSSFEGLYNDIDFASKLSRAEFETMAASFVDRIEGPVQQALDAAKLTVKDLDSIILHGGAIRTPFVQKKLESLSGKSTEVRANVNSDESAAHGAAFKAAGMSPSFRVKEIRDSEAAIYPAGITYPQDGKQRQQKLFIPTSQAGPAKQVTFKNLDDFAFTLYQTIGSVDRPVSEVQTDNLTASVSALTDKFGCTKDDISTKFNIRIGQFDGIPEVLSGTVSCEVEGSGKVGGIGDSVKGLFGFGSKKGDQEPLNEGDEAEPVKLDDSEASPSASSSSAGSKSSGAAVKGEPKKRTESINVKFTTTYKGLVQPASEAIQRMKDRLAAFDRSDKARIAREEALNVLEAFTYRARDLLSDAGFEGASTEAVRSQLSSLLSSTSDWLYGEGVSAKVDEFKSKLADLKALVDPVQKRREEAASRPELLKKLQSSLDHSKSMVDVVAKELQKASVSFSEAALSTSSTTAAPSKASSAEDLDDLDEAESSTSSSSSSSAVPKVPKLADFTPYTEQDLTSVSGVYDSVSTWLKTQITAQEALSPFEDPAVTIKEIEAKTAELNKVVMDVVAKKMQQPKRSSSSSYSKKPKTSKTKKGKKSSETTSSASVESSGTKAEDAGPSFMTVKPGDEMPSEEQILEMINKQKSKSSGVPPHEEL